MRSVQLNTSLLPKLILLLPTNFLVIFNNGGSYSFYRSLTYASKLYPLNICSFEHDTSSLHPLIPVTLTHILIICESSLSHGLIYIIP